MRDDASVLVGEPDAGSADDVTALADAAGAQGDWRGWQAEVARRAHAGLEGQGRTVDALRERLVELATHLDELAGACLRVRDLYRGYADELADLQERARRVRDDDEDAVHRARRHQQLVADVVPAHGVRLWSSPPARMSVTDPDAAWALGRWHEAVEEHEDLSRTWQGLLDDRAALDGETERALAEVPELQPLRGRVPGVDPDRVVEVAAALWSGSGAARRAEDLAALGDAAAVRAVWDQLTDAQRQVLIPGEPAVVGNLDGVPIQARAQANRLTMQSEILRIEELLRSVAHAPHAAEGLYGYSVDELRGLIEDYRYYLYSAQTVFDQHGAPTTATGVAVVVFDPAAGAIATYRGPFDAQGDVPAWVGNVAVHVPGTGTSLTTFRGTDRRAGNIYRRARDLMGPQGAAPTAVFAWAGGRFPQGGEAALDVFSRDLAPHLRDFAAAVDVHPGSSTLTVTGHSYGGAVVGMSESVGLRADRVLYVAGAGLGNDNDRVADFPWTGDVPHYALMARNDLVVGYIQGADVGAVGHGASPLDDPDVQRLETGFLDAEHPVRGEDVESLGGAKAHSGVYTVGSTAFDNIVQTIVGGQVETFAPSELLLVGGAVVTIDGVDRDDYRPVLTAVE